MGTATTPNGANYWAGTGRFIGAKRCAACHPAQARNFHRNSMSRALEPIESCTILKGDINYTWTDGRYAYSITRSGERVLYKVTEGKESFETPLLYAFGQGKAGQTYLFDVEKQNRSLHDRGCEPPFSHDGNPNTQTMEFSLRDPDEYYVTISAFSAA